jgi:aminomethyltransferase
MKNTPFTHKNILPLEPRWRNLQDTICPSVTPELMMKHAAVRKNAGVFDVSHMGEFILKGENALDPYSKSLQPMMQSKLVSRSSAV